MTTYPSSPESLLFDRARIGSGFRTVFPSSARERFHLTEGSELIVEIDEFGTHFFTFEQAARRAASIIGRYIDPARVLSDELIQDRRDEALRE